jgi:membrane protein implicated in regulation of membrane protease activity
MLIVFLLLFGGGLGLAVYAMLNGVERQRPGRKRLPRPTFNAPALAAFAAVCGAVGYSLVRRNVAGTVAALLLALAAGVLAWIGMSILMARWALRHSDTPADHDELQGQPAVVSQKIAGAELGEIRYEQDGEEIRAPARNLDTSILEAGTEVVIERIDDGVAVVEAWAAVEKRL